MRRVRRLRWPLIALVALVAALIIGYTVRALNAHDHRTPTPSPSTCASTSAGSGSGCADT